MALMLAVIWLLTHRYQGLSQDARLYAMQALATLDPSLDSDLYLQNTSQDRYTLFSPFYAQAIKLLGLHDAARLLSLTFAAGFIVAAWHLAKYLVGRDEAWPAAGALILIVGTYGSYGVFHYFEDYLTARSAAEMLVVTALALQWRGLHGMAFLMAAFALLLHPLMALPGLLLMVFSLVSLRVAAALAAAGIALAMLIAVSASTLPGFDTTFPILDANWLHIVKERAQFLFLQLWTPRDWEVNLRPFASLGLSALVLTDKKIRTLCACAALVGASGLLVAGLAGAVGPVALLVQGQAWRWMWLTTFVSVILVMPTMLRVSQDPTIGLPCVLLLAASWTATAGNSPLLAIVALASFGFRARISEGVGAYLKLIAVFLALALVCWQFSAVVTTAPSVSGASSRGVPPGFLQGTGNIAALRFPIAVVFFLTWQYIRHSAGYRQPLAMSAALGAAVFLLIPIAFAKTDSAGSAHEISEFADWRNAIQPSANVYVANGHDAAPFAWFTLERPNYLSLDQSAGVVFSRTTALEVARRSEVLLPLMDEDWKLLSRNTAGAATAPRRTPLTAKILVSVCSDPQLAFLVAREDVGFDPLRHRHPGVWKDWNLYDCGHVRRLAPAIP